jgi:hypothetical protein
MLVASGGTACKLGQPERHRIAENGQTRLEMTNLRVDEPVLQQWLSQSVALPDGVFASTSGLSDVLFDPMFESRAGMASFLRQAVDPHRGEIPGIEWRAHAAERGGLDLLRTDYQVEGLRLRLTESNNFVVLQALRPPRGLLDSPDKRRYVGDMINLVVQTSAANHAWKFELPAVLDASDGAKLISNVGAPRLADLQSRDDRSDVILFGEWVLFVFYKKIGQLEGFLPGDRWFSPAARAGLQKRQ